MCESALDEKPRRERLDYWQDFHAQLVMVGKDFCRTRQPRCAECPLKPLLPRNRPLVFIPEVAYLSSGFNYMNKTLVVVPTYNERENLPPLAQRLLALPVPVDLLVVDDNSPDGTGKLADELAAKTPCHPRPAPHGEERAGPGLHRGHSSGRWSAATSSCSRWMATSRITRTTSPCSSKRPGDADLVLGSRYLNGIRIINWPLSRLMLSKSAAKYVQIITGMRITDPTGGYKCFSRRALQAIKLEEINSNGYSFQIEMTHRLWRQGMKIVEVPIVFTERAQGHSKMSGHIIQRGLDHGLAALVPEQAAPPSRRAASDTAVSSRSQSRTARTV